MRWLLLLALVGASFARPSDDIAQDDQTDEDFLSSLLGETDVETGNPTNVIVNVNENAHANVNVHTDQGDVHVNKPSEDIKETVEEKPEESLTPDENPYLNSYDEFENEVDKCGPTLEHECVPYYLCREDKIVSDGSNIIDIRFGPNRGNDEEAKSLTHSECPLFADVCCGAPEPEPIIEPEPYKPKCGRRNSYGINARIVGFKEHESQFGEFPWMTAVLRLNETYDEYGAPQVIKQYVCGGSLIHPRVVLTAAHCLSTYADNFQVRLGEWDTQHQTEFYKHIDVDVDYVVKHEEFGPKNLHNDVALLFLKEDVTLSEHIDTVCLPDPNVDFTDAEQAHQPKYCTATGWGKDNFDSGEYQTVLKQVDLPLVNHYKCQRDLRETRLGRKFKLDDSFICAGGETEDTCTGDGGSPLVCSTHDDNYEDNERYVQTGIVAWGIGCANGNPGVYVDVAEFVYWIDDQIKTKLNLAYSYFGYGQS